MAALQPPDLAHDLHVAPAHAVVGVDDVEVRDPPPRDPVELGAQALERQLAHLARRSPGPSRRTCTRTGSRGWSRRWPPSAGARRASARRCRRDRARPVVRESAQPRARRGEQRALGPRGRAEREAGHAVERPVREQGGEHLAERQLPLAERQRVDARVLAQEPRGALRSARHRRPPEEDERAREARPRAPGDLERIPLVPHVRRERQHVGPAGGLDATASGSSRAVWIESSAGLRDARVAPRRGHEQARRQRQRAQRRRRRRTGERRPARRAPAPAAR